MALKFFWRFEGTTLDATHDYRAGSADNVADVSAAAALSATAARVGTTGGLFGPGSSDQFRFDTSTDMVNRLVGSLAFSVRFTTLTDGVQGVCNLSGVVGNYIFQIGSDGEVRVITNLEGTGESQVITSGAGITTGNWYGVVFSWDHANSLRRIRVYNAAGVLQTEVIDPAAFTAPTDLATGAGLRIGNTDGGNSTIHMDNFFIADAYDEPLQDNLTITSNTEYSSSPSSPGDASGDIDTAEGSAPAGTASSARSLSVTLVYGSGLPLASVARRFWTRNTLDEAAIDGGAGGLSVVSDSAGVFLLTGLNVNSGAGWLTYKHPSDDMNCHTVPVTFV